MTERNVRAARYEGSKRLWNLLGARYGEEYFLDIIEDRFGVADEQQAQIDRQIRTHCDGSKRIHEQRLDELQTTYQEEVTALKNELRSRNEELNKIRRKSNLGDFAMANQLTEKMKAVA